MNGRFTLQHAIRFVVLLHAVAFLLVPKNGLGGLGPFRPEDATGVLLVLVFGALAVLGPIEFPSRGLAQAMVLYFSYFLLVFVHDLSHGYVQALVFWLKEVSSVMFAYLIWRGFRGATDALLNALVVMTLPNLAYGIYQALDTPRGIYGIAPLGHEASPASAGMVYLACAIVLFVRCLSARRAGWYGLLLFVAVVLVLASGSKVAVLGAVAFWGWYLIQVALEKRDGQSIRRVGWFAIAAAGGIAIAVSAAGLGYSWRGLSRYRGLLEPMHILATRGIWWKIGWINRPLAVIFGAGYSPAHLLPGNEYSFSMSTDNQVLYYLVTGGVMALALYALVMTVLYFAIAPKLVSGRLLRALVVAYVVMGLGAEVLQLSVHGNAFWMFAGLCFAMRPSAVTVRMPSSHAPPEATGPRIVLTRDPGLETL